MIGILILCVHEYRDDAHIEPLIYVLKVKALAICLGFIYQLHSQQK